MLMRTPESINNNFAAIKTKIDSDYSSCQSIWQIYWTEATIDTRLEAGDTTLMAELNTGLPNNNRSGFYFNRVRPLCSMVSGHQMRNRKSTIVIPLENADQETADQWTKILLHIYKRAGVNDQISQAFHQGACITGMNLLHIYLDYNSDPVSGDVKVDNLAYNQFFIDPYFRKSDLSDARFVWRRTYLSHQDVAALLPADQYEWVMNMPGNPTGTGMRDGRFQYMPEAYGLTQQNRLSYDEYYYKSYRKQKLLVDKESGEVLDVTMQEDIDVNEFIDNNKTIKLIEQSVPTVRLCIMVNDEVAYDGQQPDGCDDFPFVPVLGFYNSMMPYYYSRIQGICRSLRDPQILLNRRIILSADLLESVTNSGYIFKENAPVDVKHLFQTGQGRIIPIKQEANITDIQPIVPPTIPAGFFEMQETFSRELALVSGINEELMGQASDAKAGITEILRQGAGLTTLQPLFDRLDYSMSLLGEKIMARVRANYTPGKISRILEGERPAPLFFNQAFGKYHCMVQSGTNTESQIQMEFQQKLQLKELGIPIPDSAIIECATFQHKDKLLKQMQQQAEQAQQLQQMQSQLQMAQIQAQIELTQARATADKGLGIERASRVEENKALAVERRAAAIKDQEIGMLNLVKAIKEIHSIDIADLEKLIQLSHAIRPEQQIEQPTGPIEGTRG